LCFDTIVETQTTVPSGANHPPRIALHIPHTFHRIGRGNRLPAFQQIKLKALHWEERDKRLVIKEAEIVA